MATMTQSTMQETEECALLLARQARAKFLMGKTSHAAFFGCLAMRLILSAAAWAKTAATDGKHLWVAPDFWIGLTDLERLGVIAHEVLHCALGHHSRRQGRDPDIWNVACDLVVNAMVRSCNLILPSFALFAGERPQGGGELADIIANLPKGLSAEAYYAMIQQKRQEQQKQSANQGQKSDKNHGSGDEKSQSSDQNGGHGDKSQDGENGKSSGENQGSDSENSPSDGENQGSGGEKPASACSDIGGCGQVLDAPGDAAQRAASAQEWDVAALEAAERSSTRGDLPGGLRQIIDAIKAPKPSVEELLREFMLKNCQDDYSWATPNRRYMSQGMYLPGLKGEKLPLVVITVDSSGSVGRALLKKFLEWVQAVVAVKPARLVVLYHHCNVYERTDWKPEDGELEPAALRDGGTSHAWLNDELAKLDEEPACILALTDLLTDFPSYAPQAPVLWIAPPGCTITPPFGEVVLASELH